MHPYFAIAIVITATCWTVGLFAAAVSRSDNDGPVGHYRTQREARVSLALLLLGVFSVAWIAYVPLLVLYFSVKFVRYALGDLTRDAGYTSPWRSR